MPAIVRIAQALVIASFLGLMFSPPAANLLQAALFVMCMASSVLRARLWMARRQPMVAGALLFGLVLLAGTTYSVAGMQEGMLSVWSWRKLLMLPIAAALFDSVPSKLRLLRIVGAACTLTALASFAGFLVGAGFPHYLGGSSGVLVRNYATQGLFFSVTALACACLAVFPAMGESLVRRRLWAVAALILAMNVVIVLPGRSGYVTLTAAALTLGLGWSMSRGMSLARTALLTVVAIAVLGGALTLSPIARQRIELGLHEVQTYAQAKEGTSMGLRVHFWQNTVQLIAQRPVAGWGTGGFEKAYSQLVAGREGPAGTVTVDPHNQFMKIATEQGLVGLAVFLGFLFMATRQRSDLHFRVLGLGALAGWCATSMVNSHFSTFSEGTFLYLWLGTMLAFNPPANESTSRTT